MKSYLTFRLIGLAGIAILAATARAILKAAHEDNHDPFEDEPCRITGVPHYH